MVLQGGTGEGAAPSSEAGSAPPPVPTSPSPAVARPPRPTAAKSAPKGPAPRPVGNLSLIHI
eukprot:815847-Alexandrium_andersonii.AAC.1